MTIEERLLTVGGMQEIELRVHGLTVEDHGSVPARLFANKMKQLVSALEAADILANGKLAHSYVLAQMHMSQPTAVLSEVLLPEIKQRTLSAVPIFNDAVESIKTHDTGVDRFSSVVRKISLLTSGAGASFSYAEVRTVGGNIVRIDKFLRERAAEAKRVVAHKWFDGAVMGSFDGTLQYVDIRGGSLPEIKLTLTAGGKEIDCICRREDIEALGEALDRRVRVFGRAIYSGASPLPVRVEVASIEPVKPGGDFAKWRGSFHPFAAEDWDANA